MVQLHISTAIIKCWNSCLGGNCHACLFCMVLFLQSHVNAADSFVIGHCSCAQAPFKELHKEVQGFNKLFKLCCMRQHMSGVQNKWRATRCCYKNPTSPLFTRLTQMID